jgi:flagellin
MAAFINTNIASLNAQRNLTTSQSSLATSLQRLSSGLRINSAKDDAAGLAITERMTSQIRGLNQASRNANDGISLAQTAEGSLQEAGNLLQRMRELSIQSANSTNSASDRSALQSEVNQLKQELERISSTTSFNGKKLLDGSVQQDQFQVGADANQTIQLSIKDARSTAIGSYKVTTSVDTAVATNGIQANNGLEAASRRGFVTADGAQVGRVQAAGTTNGYAATTLTVTNAAGVTDSITTTGNASAKDTAAQINAASTGLSGVTASAYNKVTVDVTGTADATDADTITVSDGTNSVAYTVATGATANNADLVAAINADSTFTGAGNLARLNTAGKVELISTTGADLRVTYANGGTAGSVAVTTEGLKDSSASTVLTGTTRTAGGQLDLFFDQGVSLATSGSTTLLTAAPVFTAAGNVDASSGNGVAAQTLSITGQNGTATASLNANDSANAIAKAINQSEATTGVKATARTEATLSGLTAAGTVSFSLQGSNGSATNISANLSGTSNLVDLVGAINAKTGETGISAKLDTADSGKVVLTQADGFDIKITDFEHSAAVDAPEAGTTSTYGRIPTEQSITVTGKEGQGIQLFDGGQRTGADSTVVGGEVSFTGTGAFNVTSSLAGSQGAIFAGAASSSNASQLSTVNALDISTVTGANDALSVLDGALQQINSIRADLGAIQNRFTSTISSLQTASENVSAARSRIQDADFAAETASLTRGQILQQAGTAMLAQANSLPNGVLALLRG